MYAGLEFGAECYCGHKIQAPIASESECNMECKGEKSNLCGGANRLSIYRLELSQESARRCESHTSASAKGPHPTPPRVLQENACWDDQMRLIFPEPPLFDGGLLPQWRAGVCAAAFTPPAPQGAVLPPEPCQLWSAFQTVTARCCKTEGRADD